MADVGESGPNLSVLLGTVLSQPYQAPPSFFDFPSSNRVPWRLGGKIGPNEERDWPDPLENERQAPGQVTRDTGHGSNNSRRQEDAPTPAHADVGGNIGPKNGGNNLTGVGRRQCLDERTPSVKCTTRRCLAGYIYLENAPRDTTHGFTEGQDRQRGRKDGYKDHDAHPRHEEHHCRPAAKSVLGPSVDNEPGQLAYESRVGQA